MFVKQGRAADPFGASKIGMQLPPFTAKSALLYLVGVAALLLCVYFVFATLYKVQPQVRIPQQQPTSAQ
jgi:uncharacterized BrkB/YihY/UPF0761 family membrane protein